MSALRTLAALAAACAALSGCSSSTEPVAPCCYQGPVTVSRLGALDARSEDGRRVSFAELFPGYRPQEGAFTMPLPVREVERKDIIYRSLEPLFAIYDANRDGRLEQPEMLVLYAREAARGDGRPIAHFGYDAPAWAIAAPNADVGGLRMWVDAKRATMTEEAQAIFTDLDRLGQDLRTRGSEGGADGTKIRIP